MVEKFEADGVECRRSVGVVAGDEDVAADGESSTTAAAARVGLLHG